jgi:hypothetical protein
MHDGEHPSAAGLLITGLVVLVRQAVDPGLRTIPQQTWLRMAAAELSKANRVGRKIHDADSKPATADGRHPSFIAARHGCGGRAAWYQRVLGLERILPHFPHYGNEETGYAVVLADMAAVVMIGLHHHVANDGKPCDERRTGLDHVGIAVPARSDLDSWAAWLHHLGVPHSGVNDTADPMKYSVLVPRPG